MRTNLLAALGLGLSAMCAIAANAQQYPMLDSLADKVIQKYQSSSCAELAAQRATPPTGRRAEIRERVVQKMHEDPGMRQAFINRVAAPIANKLFECQLIP